MERAINQIEASFYRRMERVGGFGGKADQLNAYLVAGAAPDYFAEDLARYTSLGATDVQAAIVRWSMAAAGPPRRAHGGAREVKLRYLAAVLCLSFMSFVEVGTQERPDRSRPPAPGEAPMLRLPPIHKRALSNGLRVWLVELREVPLVQVSLQVLAGSADDPVNRYGVGSLTAAMLDEGAGVRSALEIADEAERLGATLTTGSSFDSSAVRLNVPVAQLAGALSLMADVALRPTFPQADLDRLRQQLLTSLLQARDDADSIADMAFARLVFGPSHRYGTLQVGTEATIKAITRQDLETFHRGFYQPANATLVVVGDIAADAALPQLEQHFGGWKTGSAIKRQPVPPAPPLADSGIYLIDKPGAPQSEIRIGSVGVARSTPDYFPLQVLNTILGGSFTSRLNQNLRETHGYTYGAGSGFDMRLSPGPFVAAAAVQADKTSEALREFINELERIKEPVDGDELAKARNYIALGFPGEFETTRDLSRHLEAMVVYQLPDDYFARYIAHTQAVSAADVQQMAAKYIEPSRFAFVVVGDRKTIEPGLRALGVRPIRPMTVREALEGN
jgi:predicted Zn-dependent peptidase